MSKKSLVAMAASLAAITAEAAAAAITATAAAAAAAITAEAAAVSCCVCVVGKAVNEGLSNGVLILVGVLGLVDDMLEGLACLVQIDFGFLNCRLHSTQRIGSSTLSTELRTHLSQATGERSQ